MPKENYTIRLDRVHEGYMVTDNLTGKQTATETSKKAVEKIEKLIKNNESQKQLTEKSKDEKK